MLINKCILHILDFNSGITVFSEKELNLQDDIIQNYITKHIEKGFNDSNLQSGVFKADSIFEKKLNTYLDNDVNFIDFTTYIAEQFHFYISQSDKLDSMDLIMADFIREDKKYIAVMVCINKVGYTHQVIKESDMVQNTIINHYAILPGYTQKLSGFVMIDADTKQINFTDMKRHINGNQAFIIPDLILQCTYGISQKESIKLVNEIAKEVAEKYNRNSIEAVSQAKNFVVENLELSEEIDVAALGKELFEESEPMQKEYMDEIKNAGVPKKIEINNSSIKKSEKNHKIKTDTGIEITFPVDYYRNKEYIEFINNPNGTISIELKNIGKIENK